MSGGAAGGAALAGFASGRPLVALGLAAAVKFSLTVAWCVDSRSSRPAPEVPLAASMMIPDLSIAPLETSGARASDEAVT